MWQLLLNLFQNPLRIHRGVAIEPNPRWRLKPDERGTYSLEEYSPVTGIYWCRSVNVRDEAHADELIANLERQTVYRGDTIPAALRSEQGESDE
jgi:hypothetical protein